MSLVAFPLLIYPIFRLGKKIKKLATSSQEAMADLNTILSETIQGVRIIKGFSREGYEEERFKWGIKQMKEMFPNSPSFEQMLKWKKTYGNL